MRSSLDCNMAKETELLRVKRIQPNALLAFVENKKKDPIYNPVTFCRFSSPYFFSSHAH